MSQPDRRGKIKALLDSTNEGERGAAQAALGRIGQPMSQEKPAYGTKEWHEAILEWCRKVGFCDSRRGSHLLSQSEVNLVRNIARGRGDPWMSCAPDFMKIYEKLVAAENSGEAPALLEGVKI